MAPRGDRFNPASGKGAYASQLVVTAVPAPEEADSKPYTANKTGKNYPSLCPQLLPSEPMLLANLRIYFADFPECTFLYVPEHSMLGDLMR
jgi:hypothetical protein